MGSPTATSTSNTYILDSAAALYDTAQYLCHTPAVVAINHLASVTMIRRRSQAPPSGGSSKASSILNAHKPLPLSELFSSSSDANPVKKRKLMIVKVIAVSFLLVATIFFILSRSSSPSTKWMDDPLVVSLLTKTPKTKDNHYTVFITHSNGFQTETYFGTCEKSATHAMHRAYDKVKVKNDDPSYFIKVDAVMSIESMEKFNYAEDSPPDNSGFAVGDWSSLVFLNEQVKSSTLVDRHGKLRWDHIGKLWAAAPRSKAWPTSIDYDEMTVPMDFFKTQGVFFDGTNTYNLVKGKRVLGLHDMTPQYLHESAQMAGDYLTRQVHKDGTMVYVYSPRSDTEPDDEYNLTRHAGTAYAMALLYKTYKNPKLLEALQATLDYLVDVQMTDCPMAYAPGETAKCIINEVYHGHKWTQLGVNALALLAMAEYMEAAKDTVRYWDVSQELAKWIAGTQHEDGSFVQDQDIETNKLDEESYVRYYPGEAAFAIARLYNVASSMKLRVQESWKDVAANAMDYIVNRESDVEDDEFANDHWMMYACAEMAPWHWTKSMLQFALRTGRLAQERQIRHHEDEMDQDRNGIYSRPAITGEDLQSLSSCASATKSEGLCAVYPAIQQHAPESAKMILDSVKWGIRYQLGTQYRAEQSIYMKKPWKIMGALAKSIVQTDTRNDYSQHNLCSFLCLARVLEADAGGISAAE